MMRAAQYDRTGPAEEVLTLVDLAVPEPAAGEVLVRVRASGVNPSDVKRRSGWRGSARFDPPVVPHDDGAGIVESVGAGVSDGWVGRRVWVWSVPGDQPGGGTAAEYVRLPETNVVALPDEAGFEIGACLGIPACTAHFAVHADGSPRGRTVLVQGGAGAVGECAVAFAAGAGARVIAVVSGRVKAGIARRAGAHETVDRTSEDVVEAVRRLAPGGVDRIVEVDFGANAAIDAEIAAQGATIASYSSTSNPTPAMPYYALQAKGVLLRLISSYRLPQAARAAAVADITAMLRQGTLAPTIAAAFPLAEISAAHRFVEAPAAPGNVVVLC